MQNLLLNSDSFLVEIFLNIRYNVLLDETKQEELKKIIYLKSGQSYQIKNLYKIKMK